MNADDMQAGRELDQLVAEKVLGWKRGQRYGNGNGEWIVPGEEKNQFKTTWDCTPRFSTDPAAMMQVLAKLGGERVYVGLNNSYHNPKFVTWGCDISDAGGNILAQGEGATLPLAVARGALAWARERKAVAPSTTQEAT